jgi:hypothetical protein
VDDVFRRINVRSGTARDVLKEQGPIEGQPAARTRLLLSPCFLPVTASSPCLKEETVRAEHAPYVAMMRDFQGSNFGVPIRYTRNRLP